MFAGVSSAEGLLELIVFSFKLDRKSTRLNSSHSQISYAVFCLKKKNNQPLPLSCSVLFLDRHGAPRDLHSFPTRRSSDLSSLASGEEEPVFCPSMVCPC